MKIHFGPKMPEISQLLEQKLFRMVDLVWFDTSWDSFNKFLNFHIFVNVKCWKLGGFSNWRHFTLQQLFAMGEHSNKMANAGHCVCQTASQNIQTFWFYSNLKLVAFVLVEHSFFCFPARLEPRLKGADVKLAELKTVCSSVFSLLWVSG